MRSSTHARVPLPTLRRRATLRRSLGLLTDFRFEQTDPDRFYGHLAEDTVGLLSDIWADAGDTPSLKGTRILDVGEVPAISDAPSPPAESHPATT